MPVPVPEPTTTIIDTSAADGGAVAEAGKMLLEADQEGAHGLNSEKCVADNQVAQPLAVEQPQYDGEKESPPLPTGRHRCATAARGRGRGPRATSVAHGCKG